MPTHAVCTELHTLSELTGCRHWHGKTFPLCSKWQRETHVNVQAFPHCCHPSPGHHKFKQTATLEDNFILKSLQSNLEKLNLSLPSDSPRKNSCLEKSYCNTSNNYSFFPYRTNSSPSPFLTDIGEETAVYLLQARKDEYDASKKVNGRLFSFTQLIQPHHIYP